MMRKAVSIALLALIALTFSGCVRRTTYLQKSNVPSAYGKPEDNRRMTSSVIIWFWEPQFWSSGK